MGSAKLDSTVTVVHMVAMPYQGRGHINPMLNLCKLLSLSAPSTSTTDRDRGLLITFVLTEEWFGFIGSDPKPDNIRFRTIPNVLPSELVRAANMPAFIEATATKMEGPFEQLLDRLEEPPPTIIVADTFLTWAVDVGNRRSIPVASFWPLPATVFSIFYHFDLFVKNRQFPFDLSGTTPKHNSTTVGVYCPKLFTR